MGTPDFAVASLSALQQANFDIVFANDIDYHASLTYSVNFNHNFVLDDIKNNEDKNIDMETDSNNKIDILLGTDFMKTHNVVINFSKKIIIINDVEIYY